MLAYSFFLSIPLVEFSVSYLTHINGASKTTQLNLNIQHNTRQIRIPEKKKNNWSTWLYFVASHHCISLFVFLQCTSRLNSHIFNMHQRISSFLPIRNAEAHSRQTKRRLEAETGSALISVSGENAREFFHHCQVTLFPLSPIHYVCRAVESILHSVGSLLRFHTRKTCDEAQWRVELLNDVYALSFGWQRTMAAS